MLRDAFLSRLRSSGRPTVSVEFFPPKKPEEAAAMLDTARALQPLGIDFASFTYGAGGSDRSTVLEYGSKLVQAGFPLIEVGFPDLLFEEDVEEISVWYHPCQI